MKLVILRRDMDVSGKLEGLSLNVHYSISTNQLHLC